MSSNGKKYTCTRREFLRLAAGTTAGIVLTACGANPTAAPAPTTAPTKAAAAPTNAPAAPTAATATAAPKPTAAPTVAGATNLVWWTSLAGVVATTLDTMAKNYVAKNPKVAIKVENQGTYVQLRDKLLAAAAAKQLPDMILMGNGYWAPFARNNILEPLDDYIKGANGIDLKDYFPFVNRGAIDGKYYQLPIPVSAPLFYINLDMFKAANVPVPTEKWTWDQHYDSIIPALTIKDGSKVKVYGHAYRTNTWNQQQDIWAYGSQMSDDKYNLFLDSPEMINQWKRWQKLSAGGHNHIPTQAEGGTLEMFANQTTATTWASTGSLQRFEDQVKGRFKWSVLASPYGPKGRFAAEGGGGIHIVAGSSKEKKDAAWGFVKYTQEPEQVAFFAKSTGYLAFTNKGQGLIADFLKDNPLFKIAYEALGSGGRKSEPFADCARAQTLIWETLDNLAIGTQDVEKTLKQLQKDATAIMIEDGYQKK